MYLNRIIRTALASLAFASSLCMQAMPAQAQSSFPNRPVRFVVPFTPGGSNDVLARTVGAKLSEYWGQTVVVENRPGAGGNIGAAAVARSAPDGYTFLVAANNVLAINPSLYKNVPFDAIKDFAPITMLGIVPLFLVTGPATGINSVQTLIAKAKADPGKLMYASAGVGTPHHLAAELFGSMAGVEMTHVPYKGANPAVSAVLSGEVQVLFGASNSLLPQIKSGGMIALGTGGDARSVYLPNVPTIAEAGVPGFNADIWVGLVAPSGTPSDIVQKVVRDVTRALEDPAVKANLLEQGLVPAPDTPEQFSAIIKKDLNRWTKVIKDTHMTAD